MAIGTPSQVFHKSSPLFEEMGIEFTPKEIIPEGMVKCSFCGGFTPKMTATHGTVVDKIFSSDPAFRDNEGRSTAKLPMGSKDKHVHLVLKKSACPECVLSLTGRGATIKWPASRG